MLLRVLGMGQLNLTNYPGLTKATRAATEAEYTNL